MIDRYLVPEVEEIFSEKSRFCQLLEVELAWLRALESSGKIPTGTFEQCEKLRKQVNADFIERVHAREAETNHDIAAFVDVLGENLPIEVSRYIHFGLTSSDVVDTANAIALRLASRLTLANLRKTLSTVHELSKKYSNQEIMGRTHGMFAEPTTFGRKMAIFGLQLLRDHDRLSQAAENICVGKLSGAVGTFSNTDPATEDLALSYLDLKPTPATQVISRDRHAELIYSLASLGASIESIALEIRLLARSEVSELQEHFAPTQKGSSAMPHKRNPVSSERLCGMARLLRSYVIAALENVALWHERDISHSSVERIMWPDAFHLANFMLQSLSGLLTKLQVNTDKMRENLENAYGIFYSQTLLGCLVEKGMSRDSAYRIVQQLSRRAVETKQQLKDLAQNCDDVRKVMNEDELDNVFKLTRLLKYSQEAINEFDELYCKKLGREKVSFG